MTFRLHAVVTLLLSIAATLWTAGPAHAELVPSGHPYPPLAQSTLDTDTGIEWLDLHLTVGLSIDDIETGAGGWRDAGWQHATIDEVCDLFESVLVPQFPPAMSCPITGFDFPTVVTSESADHFVLFFGDTGETDSNGGHSTVGMTYGASGRWPFIGAVGIDASFPFYAGVANGTEIIDETDSSPTVGHYLVRRPGWQQAIPAMGPLASATLGVLLGLGGLIGLCRARA